MAVLGWSYESPIRGWGSVQLVSKISNLDLCDPDPPTLQTDVRTDRQTTCNLNTALCTALVHRAVGLINFRCTFSNKLFSGVRKVAA